MDSPLCGIRHELVLCGWGLALVGVCFMRTCLLCRSHTKPFIEVERKVRVDTGFTQRLVACGGKYQFHHRLVDVYYDTENHFLCKNDVWMRHRTSDTVSRWELKVGLRKGSTSPSYEEAHGEDTIMRKLCAIGGFEIRSLSEAISDGLFTVLVTVAATRVSYLVADLTVDIDVSDDGEHIIAEVEAVVNHPDAVKDASQKIADMCARLGIPPDASPPEGKVETALAKTNPRLLKQLQALHQR
ncbi:Thiamine-triphosphatase [Diplonema papillatum]|nr:Thiamine-triphosphatase [Diplonema papillatum]